MQTVATAQFFQPRWMLLKDFPEVIQIEQESFEFAWTKEDFLNCLRNRNVVGYIVGDTAGRIVGYMMYELLKSEVHILNFAVAPWFRRLGAGQSMIQKLISKLPQQRRDTITLEVRESNLDAQLFFKSCGFRSYGISHEHYKTNGEDAYQFVYEL